MRTTIVINEDTTPRDYPPTTMFLLIERVAEIVDGWYAERRIDWEDVWDRLESQGVTNHIEVEINSIDSPLQRHLKKYVLFTR